MKKIILGLSLIFMTFGTMNAQSILGEDEENNLSNFYKKTISSTKQALPYQHIRESDVIWETCIWRTIDFREKFNQFFYFPLGDDTIQRNQGRINLSYLTYRTARDNSECNVFDDDELKVPLEWESVSRKVSKVDTLHNVGEETDDYGDVIVEGHDSVVALNFNSDEFYQVRLKEYWYIDKQDTRMKVRIVGMALVRQKCKGDEENKNCIDEEIFWVPMNDMAWRNVYARANAYDMYNNSIERSYDEIFISRYFDSYITRETNVYNRNIHDYFTGEDALMESNAIEERIFDIESDMWEY